jgi:hypothetical protein
LLCAKHLFHVLSYSFPSLGLVINNKTILPIIVNVKGKKAQNQSISNTLSAFPKIRAVVVINTQLNTDLSTIY